MAQMSDKHVVIYGFCGRKGSGKDTLATIVKKENDKFIIMHFADRLKEICSSVFSLDIINFHDPSLKENLLPSPISIDSYLSSLQSEVGLPLQSRNLTVTTNRELLQVVGTDYIRSLY